MCGSLRDGDKAIRRQGTVDWIKMGEHWQSVAEGKFFVFYLLFSSSNNWVTNFIFNKENDIIIYL